MVAIVALLPISIKYITPAVTILGIGLFGYIAFSISRYGTVVESASKATKRIADFKDLS